MCLSLNTCKHKLAISPHHSLLDHKRPIWSYLDSRQKRRLLGNLGCASPGFWQIWAIGFLGQSQKCWRVYLCPPRPVWGHLVKIGSTRPPRHDQSRSGWFHKGNLPLHICDHDIERTGPRLAVEFRFRVLNCASGNGLFGILGIAREGCSAF